MHDHEHPEGSPPPVLGPESVMALEGTDQITFSLKVMTAAYCIAMQELSGSPFSEASRELITECALNVFYGHELVFGDESEAPPRKQTSKRPRRHR